MNRREFLKLSSFVPIYFYFSGASLFHISDLDSEIKAFGKSFRGSSDGKIYVSEDRGKTWQLQYQLGAQNSIQKFTIGTDKQLYVHAAYHSRSFALVLSSDGKAWLLNQKPVFS